MYACPACGGTALKPSITLAAMQREIQLRRDFVVSRLGRKAAPSELKDLTEFMHGCPAAMIRCCSCGLLMRVEQQPAASANSYEDDPNDIDLMAQLLPRYVEVQVYRALLESNAAFFAAQMTAMDTATKNSAEMIANLTLYMNKVRQAAITREIIEVVSGAQAL